VQLYLYDKEGIMSFQLRPEYARELQYPDVQDANFLGYDRPSDRWKVDASGIKIYASGISVELDKDDDSVCIWSASGTRTIPTYLEGGHVDVSVSQADDSIRVYSASGTTDIPVYVTSPISVEVDIGDSTRVLSASGTSSIPVYNTETITAHVDNFPAERYLDMSTDDVAIWSSSGASAIETWVNDRVEVFLAAPMARNAIKKRIFYDDDGDAIEVREALATSASGDACVVKYINYNSDKDVDYIVESLGTW
jgi:hypothetical protein